MALCSAVRYPITSSYVITASCGFPCTYIEVTHRDYYRTLLQVTYQNPHLDIRRIWMNRPTVDIPWEYVFGAPDAQPQMLPDFSIELLFQPSIYQDFFQQYRDIIQSHQVDFIITRVTNLTELLKAAKIPFALLLPSPSDKSSFI